MGNPKRKTTASSNDDETSDASVVSFRKKKMATTEEEVVAVDDSMETDSEVERVAMERKKKKQQKQLMKVSGAKKINVSTGVTASDTISTFKNITTEITATLFGENMNVSASVAKKVLGSVGEYEQLLMQLIAENERLKGRIDAVTLRPPLGVGVRSSHVDGMMPPPAQPLVPLVQPRRKKVVETYSAIVRSRDASASNEDLVRQVMKDVGPTLGVRVHEVKPVRSGGVLIRTPSKAETQKVVNNVKFKELGLEVQVNEKLGPRIVIQGVHSEISSDEFMMELFELNLKEKLSLEEFKKGVKLVTRPWKAEADGVVNVVLEGCGTAMDHLLETGRCYIKWFSFRVRPNHLMPGCFRCMSFDHRVAECKAKAEVCKRCGQSGHKAMQCGNAMHCRNCAFKGKPAGHSMMSTVCPIYGAIVARALARH